MIMTAAAIMDVLMVMMAVLLVGLPELFLHLGERPEHKGIRTGTRPCGADLGSYVVVIVFHVDSPCWNQRSVYSDYRVKPS